MTRNSRRTPTVPHYPKRNESASIVISWKQRSELWKYFRVVRPTYKCAACGSTADPYLEARRFGDEIFARFKCQACKKPVLVQSLGKEPNV